MRKGKLVDDRKAVCATAGPFFFCAQKEIPAKPAQSDLSNGENVL